MWEMDLFGLSSIGQIEICRCPWAGEYGSQLERVVRYPPATEVGLRVACYQNSEYFYQVLHVAESGWQGIRSTFQPQRRD
jgi:hypothetical protein